MSLSATKLASFGSLVLFADRVTQRGRSTLRSALLSQVDLCATESFSHPLLLVLGAIFVLGGVGTFLASHSDDAQMGAFGSIALGALVVIGYFMTRRNVITIHAGGGTIREAVSGKGTDAALAFVLAVEAAKKGYDARDDAPAEAMVAPQNA